MVNIDKLKENLLNFRLSATLLKMEAEQLENQAEDLNKKAQEKRTIASTFDALHTFLKEVLENENR